MGVEGTALTGSISKQLNTEETDGFYIKKIYKNSGADKAGLKVGDVIKKLDNQKISNDAEWSGFINTKRPNDKVSVTVLRNGKTLVVPVTIMKNDVISTDLNGLVLENITTDDKKKFGINGGVKIKEVSNERFKNYENVLAGSIILSIDGKSATDVETVSKIIMNKEENESYSIRFLARNGQVFNIYL